MKNIFGAFKDIQTFVREEILDHRETFDEGNIRDFIDIYLKAEKEEDRTGALTGKIHTYIGTYRCSCLYILQSNANQYAARITHI